MKKFSLFTACSFASFLNGFSTVDIHWRAILPDTLPKVLAQHHSDIISSRLKNEAYLRFVQLPLPLIKDEWEKLRTHIRTEIVKKERIIFNHNLSLDCQETGSIQMDGYTIKKIYFQTRPNLYATANLYIPDGNGPFPAVLNMHGHWREGRMSTAIQSVAATLATNGYVCMSIDAFGAGERSTNQFEYEYHGNNLGASLMNIGETLLGFQVSDNIRAIDLLCSFPFVDSTRIGATGASGGGNQTMWVTALDERVKASMPVVSVGTFESYVMNANCICELPVDVLNITEEAGILALAAPRAIKICTHTKEDIPPFFTKQMLRTYENTRQIYKMLDTENNIRYQLFDTTHGYWKPNREALIGWFDFHLKQVGNGESVKEKAFVTLKDRELMVFPTDQRDSRVESIASYCKRQGTKLKERYLSTKSFDIKTKKNELKSIIRISKTLSIKHVVEFPRVNGWDRIAILTNDDKLIPLLHLAPSDKSLGYVILCSPGGKDEINSQLIEELKEKKIGIVMPDLWGTGEVSSSEADSLESRPNFHTLSRSQLILGKTILGEWTGELNLITGYLKSKYNAIKITIDGSHETGLAALFSSIIDGHSDVILRQAPVSYVFDNRENVDFYSMAIHLPGILEWGDISLASALSGKNVLFVDPRTMCGEKISSLRLREVQKEFDAIRLRVGQPGRTIFK